MDVTPDEQLKYLKHIETPNYAAIRDTFCNDLKAAAEGKPTSLSFSKNKLPSAPLVKPGELFQVFVIGGTNGEASTVKYNLDGTVSIEDYQSFPNLDKFETVDEFLKFIDDHVDSISSAIVINFAFLMEPATGSKGQLDGKLLSGEKGHDFIGLHGSLVGAAVEQYFEKVHKRKVIVSVGNDVVCLIASINGPGVDSSRLVSGIVGTGYNMSFFLDNQTVVDVELAEYSNFQPTSTGRKIDLDSASAGKHLYEKEVAAGELFKHFNLLVNDLNLQIGQLNSSKELAELAVTNQNKEGEVARELFRRSAAMVAANFAGFYNYRNRPDKLIAVMQGGLFWEGPDYKEMFVDELVALGVPVEAIVFEMLERSGIIGAAKLITGGF